MRPALPVALAFFSLHACSPAVGSIGVVLGQSKTDATVVVRSVPPSATGERSGLSEGDEVLTIDGQDVRQMSPETLHSRLSGPVGSVVRLTVVHEGRIVRLAVTRRPFAPATTSPRKS